MSELTVEACMWLNLMGLWEGPSCSVHILVWNDVSNIVRQCSSHKYFVLMLSEDVETSCPSLCLDSGWLYVWFSMEVMTIQSLTTLEDIVYFCQTGKIPKERYLGYSDMLLWIRALNLSPSPTCCPPFCASPQPSCTSSNGDNGCLIDFFVVFTGVKTVWVVCDMAINVRLSLLTGEVREIATEMQVQVKGPLKLYCPLVKRLVSLWSFTRSFPSVCLSRLTGVFSCLLLSHTVLFSLVPFHLSSTILIIFHSISCLGWRGDHNSGLFHSSVTMAACMDLALWGQPGLH